MCNIAGYVGTKNAAPILLDLIKKQEGIAGGYYTGIATYHDGKIYYCKLTGDVKRLIKNTDAASLPGTIGIAHTRSKSGGGDEWAHPFVGMKDGEVKVAYIANGARGGFGINIEKESAVAKELDSLGYTMVRTDADNKDYPRFEDGKSVHMSDIMCQLIFKNIEDGLCEAKAMEKAFCTLPAEIVGLLLSLNTPDRIFYSRINMPASVGVAPHGTYIASIPTAFPDDAREPLWLPALSSGYVSKDGIQTIAYEDGLRGIFDLDSGARNKVYNCVLSMLEDGPKDYDYMVQEVIKLFDTTKCKQSARALYEALYSLLKDGKVVFDVVRCEGAFPDYDAPKTMVTLVK